MSKLQLTVVGLVGLILIGFGLMPLFVGTFAPNPAAILGLTVFCSLGAGIVGLANGALLCKNNKI